MTTAIGSRRRGWRCAVSAGPVGNCGGRSDARRRAGGREAVKLTQAMSAMYAAVGMSPPTAARMTVCYGFACRRRMELAFTAKERATLTAILAGGGHRPPPSAKPFSGPSSGSIAGSAGKPAPHGASQTRISGLSTTRTISIAGIRRATTPACCWCCRHGARYATIPLAIRAIAAISWSASCPTTPPSSWNERAERNGLSICGPRHTGSRRMSCRSHNGSLKSSALDRQKSKAPAAGAGAFETWSRTRLRTCGRRSRPRAGCPSG